MTGEKVEAPEARSPREDAAYFASIWSLSHRQEDRLTEAFEQHRKWAKMADRATRTPDPDVAELRAEIERLREAAKSSGMLNEKGHWLFRTEDADTPDAICDGNGEVVLGFCRLCYGGEIELDEPCADRLRRALSAGEEASRG